jgi:hypothetical protein
MKGFATNVPARDKGGKAGKMDLQGVQATAPPEDKKSMNQNGSLRMCKRTAAVR